MKKEISLKGKTAIVTGGATGIGFAIASELLDADANVIILGRREEKLKEAAKKLGERCSYYVFDITDTAHYDELISKIEETTPIDILVNNAGINNKKDYFDFTEEELDTIIATQAKAPFLFSQAVAANMKKRKSGCILFISSLASILGMHDIQAYTLCKRSYKKPFPRSWSIWHPCQQLKSWIRIHRYARKNKLKNTRTIRRNPKPHTSSWFRKRKRPWNGSCFPLL